MEAEVQQEEDEVWDGNFTICLCRSLSGCIIENHFSASCKDLLKGSTNYYKWSYAGRSSRCTRGF